MIHHIFCYLDTILLIVQLGWIVMGNHLRQAHDPATSAAKHAQARHDQKLAYMYDEKSRTAVIKDDDRLSLKLLAFEGKHKISDRYTLCGS